MRFSARFPTAIHILIITQIMMENGSGRVTSRLIAKWLGGSPVVHRNLITQLKQAGLLNVPSGKSREGVTLARPLKNITLNEIIQAVEPNDFNEVYTFNDRIAQKCPSGQYINDIISDHLKHVVDTIKREFDEITMDDVYRELLEKEKTGSYPNPRALFNDDET